jgi:hypothetical protein
VVAVLMEEREQVGAVALAKIARVELQEQAEQLLAAPGHGLTSGSSRRARA